MFVQPLAAHRKRNSTHPACCGQTAILQIRGCMQQAAQLPLMCIAAPLLPLPTEKGNSTLKPTAAGRLMAAHFLRLRTMAAIVSLGERPSVPSLLRIICDAEELRGTSLRRHDAAHLPNAIICMRMHTACLNTSLLCQVPSAPTGYHRPSNPCKHTHIHTRA
jgi:Sec63 Brl domain